MGKITITVDHPTYSEPLTYEGDTLSVKEGVTETIATLKDDDSYTAHRTALITNIEVE